MPTDRLRSYGGWAALTAGSIEILSLVFLILFFAIELPQGSASTLHFGFLSDFLPIIVAPVFLIVIVIVFLIQHTGARLWSAIAAILGVASTLLAAWTNIMFVADKITLEEQIRLFYMSLALLGPWHILVNALPRHDASLPSKLTIFGILVGVGQIVMYIGSSVLGGYADMIWSNPTAIMADIPLLISLVLGIPMALIGYLGAPIWLVWLGRTLLREDKSVRSLDKLEARS